MMPALDPHLVLVTPANTRVSPTGALGHQLIHCIAAGQVFTEHCVSAPFKLHRSPGHRGCGRSIIAWTLRGGNPSKGDAPLQRPESKQRVNFGFDSPGTWVFGHGTSPMSGLSAAKAHRANVGALRISERCTVRSGTSRRCCAFPALEEYDVTNTHDPIDRPNWAV